MVDTPKHYLTLDGLRGVAAISVMLYHRRWLVPGGHFFDHSYLAVDFFFGLSGFVVAHAYQDRLLKGYMTSGEFLLVRAIRLYPLILLGGFLGGSIWLLRGHTELSIYVATACAMLGIPSPLPVHLTDDPRLSPFSINNPGWSLFFEILVNIAYAWVARFLTVRVLIAIIAISLAWLAYATFSASGMGPLGVYYTTLPSGIPRTAFSFFSGVLIYILSKTSVLPTIKFPAIGLAFVLLLTFLPNLNAVPNSYYDLFCVVFVFPAIIVIGYQNGPSERVAGLAALGGALSYPVYLLHYPFLAWYEALPLSPRTSIVAAALLVPPLSYFVLKYYDEPVRSLLTRSLRKKRTAPAPQPP